MVLGLIIPHDIQIEHQVTLVEWQIHEISVYSDINCVTI